VTFKRFIFWSHLTAGVLSGIIVFFLSLTGVIMMYEHQIEAAAEKSFYVNPEPGQSLLTADELASIVLSDIGEGANLKFHNDEGAPIEITQGRGNRWLMNPYSGDLMGPGATETRDFFSWMMGLHRWFALEGESRDTARAIINTANLMFLFIIISGLYIWLPKIWRWPFFKKNMVFGRNLPNAKARDYNWHHVLGFWSLIPLFFIIISGSVFYYPWANNAVYAVFGEEPPQRGSSSAPTYEVQVAPGDMVSLQAALDSAKTFDEDWNTIGMPVDPQNPVIEFRVDTGTGVQPSKQTDVFVSRADGTILGTFAFGDNSPGRQARSFMRRIHTGEYYGFIGQTIFGLASMSACFLVYTGLALAYRRLLQPVFRRRKAR